MAETTLQAAVVMGEFRKNNTYKMLKRQDQEVVLYSSAAADAPRDEFVEIVGPRDAAGGASAG